MLVEELLADRGFTPLGATGVEVTGVAYRSDAVRTGDLFFCIPGTVTDGHRFAPDAASRGAAALVVSRELHDVDLPQYLVDDPRASLALASARLFDNPTSKMRVVGVTGTNGKTTTTYLVEWIAQQAGRKTGVIGTIETRIGSTALASDRTTPESYELQRIFAQMVDEGVEQAAIEVSSHAVDLDRVLGCRFSTVAFTNLTQDHLDYHHDMETYFGCKARLFTDYGAAHRVVCVDDEYGRRLAAMCRADGGHLLSVGSDPDADVRAENVSYAATGTSMDVVYPVAEGTGRVHVELHLIGRFNVQNALVAFGVALCEGVAPDVIAQALHTVPQVPGRVEQVAEAQELGVACLVDYAHTPDAIEKALSCVMAVTQGRTIIVFGCGGDRDATKRPKMGAAALAADFAVVTSDNPRTEDPDAIIADILPGMAGSEGRFEVVADRRAAIHRALEIAKPGDTVLIAGKGHEDYQIVGTEKHHFDDREVAAEEVRALCKHR